MKCQRSQTREGYAIRCTQLAINCENVFTFCAVFYRLGFATRLEAGLSDFKTSKNKDTVYSDIHIIAIDVAGDNTSNSYDRFSAHTSLFCNGVQFNLHCSLPTSSALLRVLLSNS